MSPSILALPAADIANMSWKPGLGIGRRNSVHVSFAAEITKLDARI